MNAKIRLLIALAVVSFLSGGVRQYLAPGATLAWSDVVSILVCALLIFLWYRVDSDTRNYQRSPLLNVGVIAITAIALPYYFFRSRGARGGFIALGWSIIALAAFNAFDIAGGYFTYYALQS